MLSRPEKSAILLVDHFPAARESLRRFLSRQPDLTVCGEADDAEGALREIAIQQPDLAILDISLNANSGLDLIKKIRIQAPRQAVLVFSMHCEMLYAERCVRAGARGYVTKRETPQRLLAGIRDVLGGRLSLSAEVSANFARSTIDGRLPDRRQPLNALSDRELEVFNMLGSGLASRKIAQSLELNVKTVQAHCANIKRKLGLPTAADLLREATRWNDDNVGHRQPTSLAAFGQGSSTG